MIAKELALFLSAVFSGAVVDKDAVQQANLPGLQDDEWLDAQTLLDKLDNALALAEAWQEHDRSKSKRGNRVLANRRADERLKKAYRPLYRYVGGRYYHHRDFTEEVDYPWWQEPLDWRLADAKAQRAWQKPGRSHNKKEYDSLEACGIEDVWQTNNEIMAEVKNGVFAVEGVTINGEKIIVMAEVKNSETKPRARIDINIRVKVAVYDGFYLSGISEFADVDCYTSPQWAQFYPANISNREIKGFYLNQPLYLHGHGIHNLNIADDENFQVIELELTLTQ